MRNFALVNSYVMRKVFFSGVLLFLFLTIFVAPTSCTDKKPKPEGDSTADSVLADTSSIDSTEALIEETPMPKAADELFDDFIFNFAANRRLQKKRIVFPLKVYYNGKLKREIPMDEWKMEHFFMRQQYYTLIFDNARQMNLVKDTAVNHVVIEKIFFRKKLVQQITGKEDYTILDTLPWSHYGELYLSGVFSGSYTGETALDTPDEPQPPAEETSGAPSEITYLALSSSCALNASSMAR